MELTVLFLIYFYSFLNLLFHLFFISHQPNKFTFNFIYQFPLFLLSFISSIKHFTNAKKFIYELKSKIPKMFRDLKHNKPKFKFYFININKIKWFKGLLYLIKLLTIQEIIFFFNFHTTLIQITK